MGLFKEMFGPAADIVETATSSLTEITKQEPRMTKDVKDIIEDAWE